MTASRDPDRLIHAYIQEGAEHLQDRVYDAVRAEVDRKRQRVVIGPWRTPIMNRITAAGLGVAAVVVALVVGIQLLSPPAPGGTGAFPSAESSATPTPSSSVASPSASPAAPPALTETFTSERYGFSILYPAGWVTRPATEPWTSGIPDFGKNDGDVIYHPTLQGDLWIMVASQPQGGKGEDQWVDDLLTELISEDFCDTPLEDVTIDGARGRECASSGAAVSAGDRGYLILPYVSGDDPAVGVTYDRAWFEEVLATVQLQPEDALDVAPSASP